MTKQIFDYNALATALTTGNSTTQTINFASDSDFMLKEIRTLGTAMTISIQVVSGAQFQTNPITSSVIGSGQNGWKLFGDVIMVPRNSKWQITFTNNSGGTLSDEIHFLGTMTK